MSLPLFQIMHVRTSDLEDLKGLLYGDLNFRHPIAFSLKSLNLDQQREMIGLIENHYDSAGLSFKFPYPAYLVSDHESTMTKMPMVRETSLLPKFFGHRDSKLNVKESHLIGKNKLLQLEIRNADLLACNDSVTAYATLHRQIQKQQNEVEFYENLLTKLKNNKAKKNG